MHGLVELHPHGIFLRREAHAQGVSDKQSYAALRAGAIARVRQGSYVSSETWERADAVERHRLTSHAVLMTHGGRVVLSHTSAAIMHGLDVWGCDLSVVHVTRLDDQSTRRCHDVDYHCAAIPEEHLVPLGATDRMTSPPRAVLEHASISSVEAGLCTTNAYLHRHRSLTMDPIKQVRAQMTGYPGSRRWHITLRLARPGVESVAESRIVFLCWEYALPSPIHQFPVYDDDGRLIGRSDFAWTEHRLLGEFDGKVKFEKHLRPGETPADALFREKRREDRMREYSGYQMIRFTWTDLHSRRRTAGRLARALHIG